MYFYYYILKHLRVFEPYALANKKALEFGMENITNLYSSPNLFLTTDEVLETPDFISVQPWLKYPAILIISAASLFGTAGNVLTILAIATHRNIRNAESAFFLNLAFSDLYVTAVADPMSILGKYTANLH